MYSYSRAAIAASIIAVASAQQPGTLTKEVHPALPIQSCTAGGCKTVDTSITLDANWRYLHAKDGGNCFDGSSWNVTNCPDAATCAKNCYLEGADYPKTYGVKASGSDLTLSFITNDTAVNIGSRLYMMASDTEYKMFKLLNQEFSFEVDVSNLPCGLNGALYFVEMDADGGAKEYKNNKAGAAYGTGYCDAQCPQTIKFIDGQVSSHLWPQTTIQKTNASTGQQRWMELDHSDRHIRHLLQRDGYLGGQRDVGSLHRPPLLDRGPGSVLRSQLHQRVRHGWL
jgi:cellulose 1,4-beta-cellobiosidase